MMPRPSERSPSAIDSQERRSDLSWAREWLPGFAVAMLASAHARGVILAATRPNVSPDAIEYMHLARLIADGRIVEDQGLRPPGYPVFLLVNFFDQDAVRLSQFALGMMLVAGIFYVLWKLTRSQWIACSGALLCGMNVGEMFFEASLATEALSTFLLVASLVLLVSVRHGRSFVALQLVAMGVAVGVLPLVRPLYVYVPLLFAVPLVLCLTPRRGRIAFYLIPALLPVVCWTGYLGATFDYVGLQTASGFAWTNHAGAFMNDAPERYAVIRDIYLRQVAAQDGVWTNAIWPSIPALERATGQSYPQLSQTVQRLSLELLMSHPSGYLAQVGRAFVDFWKGPSLVAEWRPYGSASSLIWLASRGIGIVVAAWFCLVVLGLVAAGLRLFRLPSLPWPCTWLALAVVIAAVVQAGVEYGGASRFGVPTYPYIVVVALCGLDVWVLRRRSVRPSVAP